MTLPIPPQTNIVKSLEEEVKALRLLGEATKVITRNVAVNRRQTQVTSSTTPSNAIKNSGR